MLRLCIVYIRCILGMFCDYFENENIFDMKQLETYPKPGPECTINRNKKTEHSFEEMLGVRPGVSKSILLLDAKWPRYSALSCVVIAHWKYFPE